MYRSLRRRLLSRLQQSRWSRSTWQATAVVLIPQRCTAVEPRWSPGPGFVEISTASKWGWRSPDGQLYAVVRSTAKLTDHQVLIRGALSADDLLGFGGITDKPHRLRWMALPGTLSEQRLTDTHPAMLYDRWVDALSASAKFRLALTDLPFECCDQVDLTRRPDGRYQVVLRLTAWTKSFGADVNDISWALTRIADSYGTGTRVCVYHPRVSSQVTDPLYAEAQRRLQPAAQEEGDMTLVDRPTDLVQRAGGNRAR